MCVAPIFILNNQSYKNRYYSDYGHYVNCGKCDSCRSSKRSEWCTRLCFEFDKCAKSGGTAIFLTFTYNPVCRPHFTDVSRDLDFDCFNRKDVNNFLSLLKVYANRRFGSGSYRFIIVSEYGHTTHLPHYHGAFWLRKGINYKSFVELCRKIWCKYGFMFPKYDYKKRMYVDDYGKPNDPVCGNTYKSARYVSKYITKDMDFYGIDGLETALEDSNFKNKVKDFLPFHRQSNGIGLSMLDNFDYSSQSIYQAFNKGVLNPLNMKYVPLPNYIINHLLFHNVRSSRVSTKSGKPLYDREFNSIAHDIYFSLYRGKVNKTSLSLVKVFNYYISNRFYYPQFDFDRFYRLFSNLDYTKLSVYHLTWSSCQPCQLHHYLSYSDGDISKLFDLYSVSLYHYRCRDVSYLKSHSHNINDFKAFVKSLDFSLKIDLFSDYEFLHSIYVTVSSDSNYYKSKRSLDRDTNIKLIKEKYFSHFKPNIV